MAWEDLFNNPGGVALAPDGLVGAPGFAFTDDSDTGLYRIGSGNVGFALNGVKEIDYSTTVIAIEPAIAVNDVTASTSGTTGSIQTDGGLGVVLDIFCDGTINPVGDTAAGDLAAIGHTTVEGLILTGQGSSFDVTIKNDADTDVLTVATGTTDIDLPGDLTVLTVTADGDTAAGDLATMGYTATEGLILTGQGSVNDVTIKNDADADVITILTGTTNIIVGGSITTSAPVGGADAWELGAAGVVTPTSPNRTIEVEIGGTAYYIHAKTTND